MKEEWLCNDFWTCSNKTQPTNKLKSKFNSEISFFSIPFILRYMIHRWIFLPLFVLHLFYFHSFILWRLCSFSIYICKQENEYMKQRSYFFFFIKIVREHLPVSMYGYNELFFIMFNSIVWPNAARFLVCACLNRIKQKIYVIFVSLSFVKVLCRFLVTGNCGLMCRLSSSSSSSFFSFQFHCVFDVQICIRIYSNRNLLHLQIDLSKFDDVCSAWCWPKPAMCLRSSVSAIVWLQYRTLIISVLHLLFVSNKTWQGRTIHTLDHGNTAHSSCDHLNWFWWLFEWAQRVLLLSVFIRFFLCNFLICFLLDRPEVWGSRLLKIGLNIKYWFFQKKKKNLSSCQGETGDETEY